MENLSKLLFYVWRLTLAVQRAFTIFCAVLLSTFALTAGVTAAIFRSVDYLFGLGT